MILAGSTDARHDNQFIIFCWWTLFFIIHKIFLSFLRRNSGSYLQLNVRSATATSRTQKQIETLYLLSHMFLMKLLKCESMQKKNWKVYWRRCLYKKGSSSSNFAVFYKPHACTALAPAFLQYLSKRHFHRQPGNCKDVWLSFTARILACVYLGLIIPLPIPRQGSGYTKNLKFNRGLVYRKLCVA